MIKELLQKLTGSRNKEFYPEKVTPDEVELDNYMEHERKARVKKMLNYYRKKIEYEQWHSNKIIQQGLNRKKLYHGSLILKGGRKI